MTTQSRALVNYIEKHWTQKEAVRGHQQTRAKLHVPDEQGGCQSVVERTGKSSSPSASVAVDRPNEELKILETSVVAHLYAEDAIQYPEQRPE